MGVPMSAKSRAGRYASRDRESNPNRRNLVRRIVGSHSGRELRFGTRIQRGSESIAIIHATSATIAAGSQRPRAMPKKPSPNKMTINPMKSHGEKTTSVGASFGTGIPGPARNQRSQKGSAIQSTPSTRLTPPTIRRIGDCASGSSLMP
jgi:hypothetical protein